MLNDEARFALQLIEFAATNKQGQLLLQTRSSDIVKAAFDISKESFGLIKEKNLYDDDPSVFSQASQILNENLGHK